MAFGQILLRLKHSHLMKNLLQKHRSISADFELRDVSFAQVVELLERIETQDPRVIVNRFNCSVNTRERGQLRKVSIGITTYETIEGK